MPAASPGSIWSILGIEDAAVVVLAGPFAASRGTPEYLVAPLYTGREPGFVWTSEDVRLEAQETGFGEPRFAAIWNARPVLEADLALQLSALPEDIAIAVRDVYWASLNEKQLGKSPRLGRPIRSAKEPAARFQVQELEKWEQVSNRVFSVSPESESSITVRYGDHWVLTMSDLDGLARAMEESECLVGSVTLRGVDVGKASLISRLWLGILHDKPPKPDLFTPSRLVYVYRPEQQGSLLLGRRVDQPETEVVAGANSNLALAA